MKGSTNWLLGNSELGNIERNGDNAAVEEPGSNEVTGGEESIPYDALRSRRLMSSIMLILRACRQLHTNTNKSLGASLHYALYSPKAPYLHTQ